MDPTHDRLPVQTSVSGGAFQQDVRQAQSRDRRDQRRRFHHGPGIFSTYPGWNATIPTEIGEAIPNDRKLHNLRDFADKIDVDYAPQRVDLITPVRQAGVRFGAVGLYLGYRQATDPTPSGYVLEAGLATGQPRVLFPARTLDTVINQQSAYDPTRFSSSENRYRARLHSRGRGRYLVQVVSRRKQDDGYLHPYIQVTIDFQKLAEPRRRLPILMVLEAACRVAAISDALGEPELGALQPLMTALGRNCDWLAKPEASDA